MSVGVAEKNGEANMPWYRCKVNEVGPASDGTETPAPVVYVSLTDTGSPPAFTSTWFYAASGIQEQVLAVAIAAINSNLNVEAGTTAPVAGNNPFTDIQNFYLLAAGVGE